MKITEHGEKRLLERFQCRDDKLKKIVIKAWYSNECFGKDVIDKYRVKGTCIKYRVFNGFLFVFDVVYKNSYSQKKLITVYNPKVWNDYSI